MPEKKVLVIDDEQDIQRLVKALLESAGYVVVSALDSMQALMIARQAKPDLIILDIRMPGGGGFKTYERLRINSNFAAIPILVYTAVSLPEVHAQIRDHPLTSFLMKPAQPGEILAAVERLLAPGAPPTPKT